MISKFTQVNEISNCEQLTVIVTIPNHEQIWVDLSENKVNEIDGLNSQRHI